MHWPSQPDAIAEIKGEQSRKHVTVGSRANMPFETNLELHFSQEYGLFPSWTSLICFFKFQLFEKLFLQVVHSWFFISSLLIDLIKLIF